MAVGSARKVVVARADDVADGQRIVVEANGRSIVVFRQDGEFFALLNRCPHRGAELCKGQFQANITADLPGEIVYHDSERLLACPWHGWEFDIRTGQSYFDPVGVRARQYPVAIERGREVRLEVEAGEAAYTPAEYAAQLQADGVAGRRPGPYVAETFEVAVEDEYVVVSLRPVRPGGRRSDVRHTGGRGSQ